MKSFAERIAEDRRLVILRLLERSSSYEHNSSLLAAALLDFGHAASRDQVETELAWLREQGLVSTREIASVTVARLTQRGVEAAQGLITVPGVKRPAPSDDIA